jgi:hypothetical protein
MFFTRPASTLPQLRVADGGPHGKNPFQFTQTSTYDLKCKLVESRISPAKWRQPAARREEYG